MYNSIASIASVALAGISRVTDEGLREVLQELYLNGIGRETAAIGDDLFRRVLSERHPDWKLSAFLQGWQATHVTALYVSGLNIRILREAMSAENPDAGQLLFRSAAELVEVIGEDTGVGDTPHGELFQQFADAIVGSNCWQSEHYVVPECAQFRKYVKNSRLHAAIPFGILTTMASENWNTGEYSYLAYGDRNVVDWLRGCYGFPDDQAERISAYVTVHAGETELGHFLHTVASWKLYCEATGVSADPQFAYEVATKYLEALQGALLGLSRVIDLKVPEEVSECVQA